MTSSKNSPEFEAVLLFLDALTWAYEPEQKLLEKIIRDRLHLLSSDERIFAEFHLENLSGLTGEQADKKYQEHYQTCADLGFPSSKYWLACTLYDSDKPDQALSLYKSAADQGHAPSQHCYGIQMFHGVGADKDETEGLKYLKLAAGRLYEHSLDFLVAHYDENGKDPNSEQHRLYSQMLSWVDDPTIR